jgi:hypothetical protein
MWLLFYGIFFSLIHWFTIKSTHCQTWVYGTVHMAYFS